MKVIFFEKITDSWVETTADPQKYTSVFKDKIPFKALIIQTETKEGESVAIVFSPKTRDELGKIHGRWDKVISQLAELEGLKEEIERISSPSSKSK